LSLGYYGYQVLYLKADATIQVGHSNGICRNVDNSILFLSGGSSPGAGANIEIGGPTGGSSIYHDATAHTFRSQDALTTVAVFKPGNGDTIRFGSLGIHEGGEKNFNFNCYFNGANWIRINTGYVHQFSTTSGGSNMVFRYGTTGTAGTVVALSDISYYHGSLWRNLVPIEVPYLTDYNSTNSTTYYLNLLPWGDGTSFGKQTHHAYGGRYLDVQYDSGNTTSSIVIRLSNLQVGHVISSISAYVYLYTTDTFTMALYRRAYNSGTQTLVASTTTATTNWQILSMTVNHTVQDQVYWLEFSSTKASAGAVYMSTGVRFTMTGSKIFTSMSGT